MEPLLGEIKLFPGNFAPEGWYSCEGQMLSINQFAALFSILGTSYGGDGISTFGLPDLRGAVPAGVSLSGQAPFLGLPLSPGNHGGNTASAITGGSVSGSLVANGTVTIGINNLPAHTHAATALTTANSVNAAIPANNNNGPNAAPSGQVLGFVHDTSSSGAAPNRYAAAADATSLAAFNGTIASTNGTVANANTGSNTPITVTLPVAGAATINGNTTTLQPYLAMIYIIAYEGIYPSRP